MSIWKFAELLPPVDPAFQVTLGEGGTPLVRARRLGVLLGLPNLYFKLESGNPTGSYKDRFAALAISDMLQNGQKRCLATSSGNTGAALAAYCARASLECEIAIVETAPDGKLTQMLAYGANIYRVRGFGLDAGVTSGVMDALARRNSGAESLQISAYHYSPVGMEGVCTISFEMASQQELDHVFCPAGGGGLTLAVARGYEKWCAAGLAAKGPAIHCVQPEGNDTIAGALRAGSDQAKSVVCTSGISGLQVASVLDGHEVIAACRRSGGTGHLVSDEAVFAAQKLLAREEGIFSEPAGAVALAGVIEAKKRGELDPGARIACLVTGSGFKDGASVGRLNEGSSCPTIEFTELGR